MFCFTSMPTLYFAKMIYKCKLVGVVSKERMRTYILTRVIKIHAGLVELAFVRRVGTVHLRVVCGTWYGRPVVG